MVRSRELIFSLLYAWEDATMDRNIAATTDIGTELLFENDRVRVWQMLLAPGEESRLHRHERDYLFVYTTPSRLTVYHEGQPPSTGEYDDGFVSYTAVGEGLVPHKLRNDGAKPHRQILVEFKGPSFAPTLQPPETNGRSR